MVDVGDPVTDHRCVGSGLKDLPRSGELVLALLDAPAYCVGMGEPLLAGGGADFGECNCDNDAIEGQALPEDVTLAVDVDPVDLS